MIDIKDVITLSDGKQYGVVSKAIKDSVNYYFLVETDNISNIKICYEVITENQIELIEFDDENLVQNLLLLFVENIKNEF